MNKIKIKPFFLILEAETDELKFPEIVKLERTARPVFINIFANTEYYEMRPKNKTITYAKFIKEFQKVARGLIETSDILSTSVELNTATDEYFISAEDLINAHDAFHTFDVKTPEPDNYFAVFVCPIALLNVEKLSKLSNKSFLGSSEKVFLFAYESDGEPNQKEKEILNFQSEIRYTAKFRKYVYTTYDCAVYDWISDLKNLPLEQIFSKRFKQIKDNLYNG